MRTRMSRNKNKKKRLSPNFSSSILSSPSNIPLPSPPLNMSFSPPVAQSPKINPIMPDKVSYSPKSTQEISFAYIPSPFKSPIASTSVRKTPYSNTPTEPAPIIYPPSMQDGEWDIRCCSQTEYDNLIKKNK